MRMGVWMAVLCMAWSVVVRGQEEFPSRLYEDYLRGVEENERGMYLDAYKTLSKTNEGLNSWMEERAGGTLSGEFFEIYWWPIKRSLAEVAYMLGLHRRMQEVLGEMRSAMVEQQTADSGQNAAEVAKLEAGYYFLTGNYEATEERLMAAWRMASRYERDFLNVLHEEKAQLYYVQGRYDEALSELQSLQEGVSADSRQWAAGSDEDSRGMDKLVSQQAICLARMGEYGRAREMIEGVLKRMRKDKDKRAYAEGLRKKGKILTLEYDATGEYNREAARCYNLYFQLSRDYLNEHLINMTDGEREQYWMGEHELVTDCFRLEGEAPELVYNTALYCKALLLQVGRRLSSTKWQREKRKVLEELSVTWKDVRGKLSDTAVAIEFIVYEKRNAKQIGAVIIRKGWSKPRFVHIGPLDAFSEREIMRGWTVEDILRSAHESYLIDTLYRTTSLGKEIWTQELIDLIGDSRRIYFSPDGIFLQLGIEYLVPRELAGREFFRLTSTRQLTNKRGEVRDNGLLMVGGVDYKNEAAEEMGEGNDELAYELMSTQEVSLAELPGSLEEVDSIYSIRGNRSDLLLYADSATEGVLRGLLGEYHLVHLSTHGYFDEAGRMGTEIRPAEADVQLSHSCLFLSGAERNLKDRGFDTGGYDGVLSGREIAGMDLSNVDLVVLSACMSGMGYVTPDGVYGLQRGLMTAGVRSVVASLWMVDDEATSLMMRQFYINLKGGMSLKASFDKARESLQGTTYVKRYRSGATRTVSYDSPYYYNAFILIDGLE